MVVMVMVIVVVVVIVELVSVAFFQLCVYVMGWMDSHHDDNWTDCLLRRVKHMTMHMKCKMLCEVGGHVCLMDTQSGWLQTG